MGVSIEDGDGEVDTLHIDGGGGVTLCGIRFDYTTFADGPPADVEVVGYEVVVAQALGQHDPVCAGCFKAGSSMGML